MPTPDEDVDAALAEAAAVATAWSRTTRAARGAVLSAIAGDLDADADRLVHLAMAESHLPEPRLRGELTRTTFQLRYLAGYISSGEYLDARIDTAVDDWPMGAPRPDLRRTHVPIGPVLVFAASNFPFAFSVVGGDTASALAAGCPVVVKTHPGHPQLSAAVAEVAHRAAVSAGMPAGALATIAGRDAGVRALRDPRTKAAAFTGSIPGGRALFDIASARPEPIPFYGELGSVNPVFVTEAADHARGDDIAAAHVASFTLGAGQFCTSPGLLIVPSASRTLDALSRAELPAPMQMLTDDIAGGFERTAQTLASHEAVEVIAGSSEGVSPRVLRTTAAAVIDNPDTLLEECFGPLSLVVTYDTVEEMLALARALPGQLTCTVHGEDSDIGTATDGLVEILTTRAGRLLWNQWPTGVSVTGAQQHGGPYPATTAPQWTSVGTASVLRFVRPVAFQGFPDGLLPDELRQDTAHSVPQRIDDGSSADGL